MLVAKKTNTELKKYLTNVRILKQTIDKIMTELQEKVGGRDFLKRRKI